MPKRQLTGKIISDKMDKTIVVRVESLKKHPKYLRRYKMSKNYKVHDPNNEFKTGDRVTIQEASPQSKNKNWTVIKTL